MSPATVTENEGECKTSEPVQYPLFIGHLCLGEKGGQVRGDPTSLEREIEFFFSHGCARTPYVVTVGIYYFPRGQRLVWECRCWGGSLMGSWGSGAPHGGTNLHLGGFSLECKDLVHVFRLLQKSPNSA